MTRLSVARAPWPCPRCTDLRDVDSEGGEALYVLRLVPAERWRPYDEDGWGRWGLYVAGWRLRPAVRRAVAAVKWAFYTSRVINLTGIARRKGVSEREIIAALRCAPEGPEFEWARRTLRSPTFRAEPERGGRCA